MIVGFLIFGIVIGIMALLLLSRFGKRFHRKTLDASYYEAKWSEVLARVKTPEGMILAVIDGDKLLDDALIKLGYRGKTMGERMVAAQKTFSNNDSVWFAHKLRNRLVHEPDTRLRQHDAKTALAGFRQGLRDLGAIK